MAALGRGATDGRGLDDVVLDGVGFPHEEAARTAIVAATETRIPPVRTTLVSPSSAPSEA
jgi:hypothetical protein